MRVAEKEMGSIIIISSKFLAAEKISQSVFHILLSLSLIYITIILLYNYHLHNR